MLKVIEKGRGEFVVLTHSSSQPLNRPRDMSEEEKLPEAWAAQKLETETPPGFPARGTQPPGSPASTSV